MGELRSYLVLQDADVNRIQYSIQTLLNEYRSKIKDLEARIKVLEDARD